MSADPSTSTVEALPSKVLPQVSLKLFLTLIGISAILMWLIMTTFAKEDSVWIRSLVMAFLTIGLCFAFYASVYAIAWVITLPFGRSAAKVTTPAAK